MSLQRGINLRALAEKMGQCSGAEVRGICAEAGTLLLSCALAYGLTTSPFRLGMYALRERRQHVTQEDFEFAVAKACISLPLLILTQCTHALFTGFEEEPRGEHFRQQALFVESYCISIFFHIHIVHAAVSGIFKIHCQFTLFFWSDLSSYPYLL